MGFFCVSLMAQDCGAGPTGMNLVVSTSTCIKGMFYRPLIEKKYWNDPKVPEYWKYFVISRKPYFTQGNNEDFIKYVDTTTVYFDHQEVENRHEAYFFQTDLYPGVSYQYCIYTYCEEKKYGALCYAKTTTLEPPYILKFDSVSDHLGIFKFIYKKDVNVLPKEIIFQYREKDEGWITKSVNFGNIYLEDLKPGHVYIARYKVIYYHGVETDYCDEKFILF